jgi:hypothetical protein
MMLGYGIGFEACNLPIPAAPTAVVAFYPISGTEDR